MIKTGPGPGYSLENNCIEAAKLILLFVEKTTFNWKRIIAWVLPVLGLALLYLAFRHIPFEALKAEIRTVRPVWLLLLLIPSWGGQFLRTWRWRLLLKSPYQKLPFFPIYHALLMGYFVNLGLPRVGEISRCVALDRQGVTGFGKSFGTVVIERVVDMVFLFLVLGLALLMQWESLNNYFTLHVFEPTLSALQGQRNFLLILAIMGFFALVSFLLYRKRLLAFLAKSTRGFSAKVQEGLLSLTTLRRRELFLFILLSILIWVTYFLTTWFWFLALPSASGAGMEVAFSVMVMGSIAKTLPIQGGGAGAYHLLIGKLLLLYGLGEVSSQTFALLNHGYQTVFYLLFGGFSAFCLAWKRKKQS